MRGQGQRKWRQIVHNMSDEADGKTVRYHRRLDRTPEKEFEKLPDSEKKLISAMRGALENCRNKVEGMKNDLAEK